MNGQIVNDIFNALERTRRNNNNNVVTAVE